MQIRISVAVVLWFYESVDKYLMFFFCFPWPMSPDKIVSLDFTYITSVIVSTEKLMSYIQLLIVWNVILIEEGDANLNVFTKKLIIVPCLQKYLAVI